MFYPNNEFFAISILMIRLNTTLFLSLLIMPKNKTNGENEKIKDSKNLKEEFKKNLM